MFCLSASLEDYIEVIYILDQQCFSVGITDISSELSISKPSVTKAVKLLKSKGLLFQEKYGKINLTVEGKKVAKEIYQRHQILSKFLVDALGVSKKTAEIDACKIEHILSRETIGKIKKFLNFQKVIKKVP